MLRPSAREWLARLRGGELSAYELASDYLVEVDRVSRELNAIITCEPERVLSDARRADERRRAGEDLPLLGLPLTIKDALETEGLRSTGGSLVRAEFVPDTDATVVARLRAAGAIVLAKTNLPEYSWSTETDNVVHGRTDNPLDPARTCGGSSGGEAAALGADASPAGIGTDGGGSIRVPTHYCGTVGLRPSVGLVPETGYWPPSRATGMMGHNCIGPMGRFVEDLELLLPVIAGADDADPYAVPVPVGDPRSVQIAGLRVRFYAYDGCAPVTDGTRRAVELAATTLADAGALVEEAVPPQVADATELFFASMAADGGAQAREDLCFGERPMDPALEKLLGDLSERALDAGGYFDVQRRIFDLRRRFREFMRDVDILLCPVAAGCAPLHGHWPGESAGSNSFAACNYSFLISLVGLPSAVVPVGEEEGMPIGVQIVARAFQDHVSLAAARVLEQVIGGFAGVRARQSATTG